MNKVINRHLFDTDTATRVATFNACSSRYKTNFVEILFRKKKEEYFLYAKGGPRTHYVNEEKIIPLHIDEAKNWAEDRLSGDDYMKAFGEVEE